ncbi:hypothetical protein [Hymenobacter convexus]|uniref:hypothetical protein n=1 Tax=Hymenobacter sp. CA1UV-4 TaxID=3063782 RepID=UPI002712FB16|nr:hypothetical protein [Hymenobacter sp. CA1UV-4]MDO7854502.1 hypothetical protein [Hymenobacter sp. CA1UV-4]
MPRSVVLPSTPWLAPCPARAGAGAAGGSPSRSLSGVFQVSAGPAEALAAPS